MNLKTHTKKLKDKLKFASEKLNMEDLEFSQSGNTPNECEARNYGV